MSSQFIELPPTGGVTSLNSLIGDLTLAPGANISITPSGGDTLTISASGGLTTFPLLAPSATAGAPSYSWSADSTTGLFRPSGGTMAVSVLGTKVFQFNAANNNSAVPLTINDGSANAPTLALTNNLGVGLYKFAANSLGFATSSVSAGHIDASQQWSFGAPINPTRIHGFYKDVNAGESTNSVVLQVGNSGSSQGVGYLSFNNQIVTNSPSFDLSFSPRNNGDTASVQVGLIRMQKGGTDNSGNMYFSTSDASGALNLAATITSDGNLELGPENELRFADAVGGQYVGMKAPTTVNGTTTYILPDAPPASNKVLQSDSSSVLTWVDVGPGGAAGSIQWNNAGPSSFRKHLLLPLRFF
jgi:hypothetical protein